MFNTIFTVRAQKLKPSVPLPHLPVILIQPDVKIRSAIHKIQALVLTNGISRLHISEVIQENPQKVQNVHWGKSNTTTHECTLLI